MIASLLLLAPALQSAPTLHVREADGYEWAADLAEGETLVILPTVTSSDRVPRAVLGPRGFTLRVATPDGAQVDLRTLSVRAVEHGADVELLRADGELVEVRGARLPAFARLPHSNELGTLARFDGHGVEGGGLQVAAGPAGTRLVLLAGESALRAPWLVDAREGEGPWSELRGGVGPRDVLLLPGETAWELRSRGTAIDRLYHAQVAPLEDAGEALAPRRVRTLAVERRGRAARRGSGLLRPVHEAGDQLASFDRAAPHTLAPRQLLELEFPAPAVSEGSAMTLLVRVDIALEARPEEASARADDLQRPWFLEASQSAVPSGVHFEGPHEQRDIRPTMGPGAAWGDVNGDGLPDLYVVQGGGREGSEPPTNRLLINQDDGSFVAAPAAGVEDAGAGMGALFFDLEGDGDLDLYVANYGPDKLFRNDGGVQFTDVSAQHQLAGDGWSAGVAAADHDGDGDLDLYVTTYLVYDTALMPPVEELPGYQREDPVEMLPFAFPGGKNHFLENDGGTLRERADDLGLGDEQGRGMQPIWWDFDLDGDLDLYVANDVSYNVLYRNEGDGTFKDISFLVGLDDPRGGMGVTTGDVDLDGDLDLFLTNWELEANALYRNNLITGGLRKSHTGTFQDVTVRARLGNSVGATSWGCVFFDADNDGDLDLFVPNGYTSPDYESTGICVGQPNQFYLNDGEGRFEDASAAAGPAVTAPLASRAAAIADYDGDGGLDVFVTNNNGPYQLLRNVIPGRGNWLGLRLIGSDGNTQAVGARVTLGVDGLVQTRVVEAGSGYLAGHTGGVHFGLGEAEAFESLEVRWPSGRVTSHRIERVNRWTTLREPAE